MFLFTHAMSADCMGLWEKKLAFDREDLQNALYFAKNRFGLFMIIWVTDMFIVRFQATRPSVVEENLLLELVPNTLTSTSASETRDISLCGDDSVRDGEKITNAENRQAVLSTAVIEMQLV